MSLNNSSKTANTSIKIPSRPLVIFLVIMPSADSTSVFNISIPSIYLCNSGRPLSSFLCRDQEILGNFALSKSAEIYAQGINDQPVEE